MINIWEYAYAGKVRLTDIDGKVYIGDAWNCDDGENMETPTEDSITIFVGEQPICFSASEIKSIEKIA